MAKHTLIILFIFRCNFGSCQTIYLHTDRPYYTAPDTVWFKIYSTNTSNITFLQLLQEEKVIAQKIISMQNPFGYIALPDSLKIGKYTLSVFQQVANKQIASHRQIIEIIKNGYKKQHTSSSLNLAFFPEGGNFVAGSSSLVAFKATNQNGEGVEIEGEIVDSLGNLQTIFKTESQGMGKFWLTPIENNNYYAKIKYKNQTYLYSLLKPQKKGIVLGAKYTEKDSTIIVTIQQKNIENEYKQLQIRAFIDGNRVFNQIIPKRDLSILKIPVFNQNIYLEIYNDTSVLIKRLILVRQPENWNIQTNLLKDISGNQKEINIEIQVSDKNQKPVEGNFSISVTDSDQINIALKKTDISHFSSLQRYFTDEVEQLKNLSIGHLDLIALTHNYYPNHQQKIDTTLIFTGSVRNFFNQKKVSQAKVIMSYNTEKGRFFEQVETNDDGNFSIINQVVVDTNIVFMQARHKKFDKLTLELDKKKIRLDSVYFKKTHFQSYQLENNTPKSNTNDIELFLRNVEKSETIILNEVLIKSNKLNPRLEQITQSIEGDINGPNIAMQTRKIFQNDQPQARTLMDLLNKKTPEIFVKRESFQIDDRIIPLNILAVVGGPIGFYPILTYLNGSYVMDSGVLASYPANEVATLVYYIRSHDFLPVLIIVTKNSIPNYDYSKDKVLGTLITKGLGFSTSKEFYSPKYENGKQNTKPDYRATLYWNPNIKTDKDGKATISFYNSDIAKKFNISIEGTDGKGNVGSLQKVIE